MGALYYAGIDPGLSGAFAVLDPHDWFGRRMDRPDLIFVSDFPTFSTMSTKGKKRTHLDLARLFAEMRAAGRMSAMCAIEQVSAMPGQGVSSMFRFGESYGMVQALAVAAGWQITHVTPAKWKADLRLAGGKDASRKRCIEIWPEHAAKFALVKDHGKADATLIAYWRWKQGLDARASS